MICDFVFCCFVICGLSFVILLVLLFCLGDAKFVMMMSTPAPACMMIAGVDAHVEYCCFFDSFVGWRGVFS